MERLSPKLFDEWMAYSLLEPFGEEWRQTAQICATSLNAMGGKKGGKAFTADDFLPKLPSKPLDEKTQRKLHKQQWLAFATRLKQAQGRISERAGDT